MEHVAKFLDAETSVDLAHKILICSKFSHTSSIDALHLIDYQQKSGSSDFLDDSRCLLRNAICDLYKQNIDASVASLQNPFIHAAFAPIKVVKGNKVCCRCEKVFTVRLCQYRMLTSNCVQFTRKIAGKKFTDHQSVNYLNLLDYTSKAYDFFPHIDTRWYNKDIFAHFLPLFQRDIKDFPVKLLPIILPKLITALKLLDMEDSSTVSLSFYFQIIDTILEKKYQEPSILIKIWKSVLMSERFMVCTFEKLTDHLPNRSNERLKWVLIMASYLQFDFYGAWVRGNKLRNFPNCPVSSAMISGNYKEMKTLLDNGFLKNTKLFSSYNVLLRILARLDSRLSHPLERSAFGQMPIVREVLIFLIVRHINREDNLRSELDKCFYLLWSSIPEPTVTKQQLMAEKRIVFLRSPANQDTAELKEEMETIINSYDKMLFGTERMPRSLCHLCRCFIRRALSVSGNLPHGVAQLEISKNLQSYLLLTIPQDFL
ncbi:unnamed protein product [Larinioides sclopetarius]|uniref:SOCS box domain-containing protein n=1 Tax=Larinioides sclopetarius TaxID=280406 RepID=A0AAV2APL1_9ARAC